MLGFLLAWLFFVLTLAAALAAGLWVTRPRQPTVDWDRFMADLEFWAATRSG
jgi:hypothetical protein